MPPPNYADDLRTPNAPFLLTKTSCHFTVPYSSQFLRGAPSPMPSPGADGRLGHLLGRQGHFRGPHTGHEIGLRPEEIKPIGIAAASVSTFGAAASVSTFGREIEFLPKADLIWFVIDLINNELRRLSTRSPRQRRTGGAQS